MLNTGTAIIIIVLAIVVHNQKAKDSFKTGFATTLFYAFLLKTKFWLGGHRKIILKTVINVTYFGKIGHFKLLFLLTMCGYYKQPQRKNKHKKTSWK